MATQNFQKFSSPYVSVDIIDQSQQTNTNTGTNIPVFGFAAQGPVEEPTSINSSSDFYSIFGNPTTAAERYAANAITQLADNSPANVTFTRLAPGSGLGLGYSDQVTALVFPVIGVSAVEVNPCTYFRQIDETNCSVNFPWLLNSFAPTAVDIGSSNLYCPINSIDETPDTLYVLNDPVPYDSVLTGFKFVANHGLTDEYLQVYQLRTTVPGDGTTSYQIITSFNLQHLITQDVAVLSNDGLRVVADIAHSTFASVYTITNGPFMGNSVSGIMVNRNDIFATFANDGDPVISYVNASPGVAKGFKTTLTNFSALSTGATFSLYNSALNASTTDILIDYALVPIEAGISCQTVTALGLQVPEQDRYNFYPLVGDAQLRDANFYVLGAPISQTLNAAEYELFQNDQFNWKCGTFDNVTPVLDIENNNVAAGIIVVNDAQTAQLDDFSGYYLTVNDNLNVNPSTDFNSITGVNGYYNKNCHGISGSWIQVPAERVNFQTTALFNGAAGSISEIVENSAGVNFGTQTYNDSLVVNLFKLTPESLTSSINTLKSTKVETFIGSLDATRKIADVNGGPPRSAYLETTINNGSNYLKVKINPYLSQNNCWDDASGVPQKTVRMFRSDTSGVFNNFDAQAALTEYADNMYGAGAYTATCVDAGYQQCLKKDIGNLPAKLQRALNIMENPSEYLIDLTVDSGLSTIWSTRAAVQADSCVTDTGICYNFDDTYYVDTSSLSPYNNTSISSDIQEAWQEITNTFLTFATTTRKNAGGTEHLHIIDPIRQIFVNGKDYKVYARQKKLILDPTTGQPSDAYATFSRNIWAYLQNNFSGTSSPFAVADANWYKVYDSNSDQNYWVGSSAHLGALYANNDFNYYPWTAALGYKNGAISNILDIAINPNQRERDLLSRINLNPTMKSDLGGYVRWNTLTLQQQQSALQEDYIIRGALWLAKSSQRTLRNYIGQPNNVVTRTRMKNDLTVLAQYMKDNYGLDYFDVICDERNNSADSIAQGVINCALVVQFTRTTKYINLDIIVDRNAVGVTTSSF